MKRTVAIVLSFLWLLAFVQLSRTGETEERLAAEAAEGHGVKAGPAFQSQVPPAQGQQEQRLVKLDFEDVDILLFIKFISEITGRNFLIDPKVKGKVTIVSAKEVSVEEAYEVFQSVLEVHGFTTVPAGSIIKIVPAADARVKAVETQSVSSLSVSPKSH